VRWVDVASEDWPGLARPRTRSTAALFIIGPGARLPGGVDVDTRVDRLLKRTCVLSGRRRHQVGGSVQQGIQEGFFLVIYKL